VRDEGVRRQHQAILHLPSIILNLNQISSSARLFHFLESPRSSRFFVPPQTRRSLVTSPSSLFVTVGDVRSAARHSGGYRVSARQLLSVWRRDVDVQCCVVGCVGGGVRGVRCCCSWESRIRSHIVGRGLLGRKSVL